MIRTCQFCKKVLTKDCKKLETGENRFERTVYLICNDCDYLYQLFLKEAIAGRSTPIQKIYAFVMKNFGNARKIKRTKIMLDSRGYARRKGSGWR